MHISDEPDPKVSILNLADADSRQRLYCILFVSSIVTLATALSVYGWNYYSLDLPQRPFSPLHAELKPSGTIGLRLGFLGGILFAAVFLYPLRKYWSMLGRIGKTGNWFRFHVLLGLCAPVVITFHSAFKTYGFAGMAYWAVLALVGSGIVGRYFYAQIPRNIKAAEMSLHEMEELKHSLVEALKTQMFFAQPEIESLFQLPGNRQVAGSPMILALFQMIAWDLRRPFRIWTLRRRGLRGQGHFAFSGGIWQTGNAELEKTIALAVRQAALSKRILFLSKTQKIFHLWHIIHRPFSISFAVFVIIHVTVVAWLGYY